MAYQTVTRTGFFGNLKNAIVSALIGILLFLGSFVVLFMNEGRTNWGKVAEESTEVDASSASGHDGEFVSVTGALTSSETLGDPQFVAPGNFIQLDRSVEVYVWVEHSETETRDKVGGGTETTTTYTYSQEWSSSIPDSSQFEDPAYRGVNPGTQMRWTSESYSVNTAAVGAWSFTMADLGSGPAMSMGHGLPGSSSVSPSSLTLTGDATGPGASVSGEHVYLANANPNSPVVGDYRVSFSALTGGETVTMFAKAEGGMLKPWPADGDKTMMRALRGDRASAIASLVTEYKAFGWMMRIVGFFMMWIGMSMVFAPLHAVAGILPFLKKGTKFLVGLITFPIALVLTTVTVIISMVLHSWVAMLVVTLMFGGLVFFLWSRRSKGDDAQQQAPVSGYDPAQQQQWAQAGGAPGVPPGPPPGPPPGGPPQGGWGPPGAPPGPPPA